MTVTLDEIKHVCKLMRIDIEDHAQYLDQVHQMIDYFGILDSAGVESESVAMPEISLSDLREDKHIPFDDKLIQRLNHYKGTSIRAPKMSS